MTHFIFEVNSLIRENCLKAIENLSEEQLNKIPQGLNNNIAWNLGHMVASQQILCYRLGNAPLYVPDAYLSLYKKDTSPKNWTAPADIKEIKEYFKITSAAFEADYNKKIFSNFSEYKTSAGALLKNIDDALVYNYGHENLHYGVILNLRKLV